jgi:hypothetical protein
MNETSDLNLVQSNHFSGSQRVLELKKTIHEYLYPEKAESFSFGSMAIAQHVFYTYQKGRGNLQGLIDLMLFYVECGTQLTIDVGDIDEGFCEALENIFEEALRLIKSDMPLVKVFESRINAIVKAVEEREVGYDYDEQILDIVDAELPELLED